MRLKNIFDSAQLGAIARDRGSGVGIDVIDLVRRNFRIRERVAHGARETFAVRLGRHDVVSI